MFRRLFHTKMKLLGIAGCIVLTFIILSRRNSAENMENQQDGAQDKTADSAELRFEARAHGDQTLFAQREGEAGGYQLQAQQKPQNIGSPLSAKQTKAELRSIIRELSKRVADLETAKKQYPHVRFRNYKERKRILITGGAGFVGSHLVDKLMMDGHEVIVADNYFTGRKRNVEHWVGHKNFELMNHDIVHPLYIQVDEIYHLASPASPPHYMYNPVKTIKTNTVGTVNMLGLAKRVRAKLLLASTSEVYGDPEEHPQKETYWGHVNPIGPRACYDEGKRVAETLCYAYAKQENVPVRVARIFNTFGPRMHMNDGRVVSNFILEALQGEPISMYGDGLQTRSFQYVTDLVNGMIALMNSNYSEPVNIGNPEEHTILDFAKIIRRLTNSQSPLHHRPPATDDPQRRKPDITRAMKILGWKPTVALEDGLMRTIHYFENELKRSTTGSAGELKQHTKDSHEPIGDL